MLIRPTKNLLSSNAVVKSTAAFWNNNLPPSRFFASGTKFKSGMSEEFGQGAIADEEFLPNQEEVELKIR